MLEGTSSPCIGYWNTLGFVLIKAAAQQIRFDLATSTSPISLTP
jgi:hypothetical protein